MAHQVYLQRRGRYRPHTTQWGPEPNLAHATTATTIHGEQLHPDTELRRTLPMLLGDGSVIAVDACLHHGSVSLREGESTGDIDVHPPYLVAGLPIDIHRHGIQHMDLCDLQRMSLGALNDLARAEGIVVVPCVFLRPNDLAVFEQLLTQYEAQRTDLPFVGGVALEGPMLSSWGGTPRYGTWLPSQDDWKRIASWGSLGLLYDVLAPDALDHGLLSRDGRHSPKIEWIVETLLDGGVVPAIGHVCKDEPLLTATCIDRAIDVARSRGCALLTDHLFNDMPSLVRYAWRDADARRRRPRELARTEVDSWDLDQLDEQIGPVPAALVRAAAANDIRLFMNFDGEHVDSVISHRIGELIGWRNVVAMTDCIDQPLFGREPLVRQRGSSLWWRTNGTVAAGSLGVDLQMVFMRTSGASESSIWDAASFCIGHSLGIEQPGGFVSLVTDDGRRLTLKRH